ncbi:MAG: DUF86 domain-containing protein [Deltaproteobacteria bacterium]|nr:DUF86 domain-containing protein [Deltaproteobacteria bacterium]
MKKDPLVYIDHILQAIDAIESFTGELTKEVFFGSLKEQGAIIYQLAIIGEAVTKLPAEFKVNYPEVPWIDISTMRNYLIHEYHRVNLNTVWITATKDILILKQQLTDILNSPMSFIIEDSE